MHLKQTDPKGSREKLGTRVTIGLRFTQEKEMKDYLRGY
jgi:hypothetical protein